VEKETEQMEDGQMGRVKMKGRVNEMEQMGGDKRKRAKRK
jgi:hypothetical protein